MTNCHCFENLELGKMNCTEQLVRCALSKHNFISVSEKSGKRQLKGNLH